MRIFTSRKYSNRDQMTRDIVGMSFHRVNVGKNLCQRLLTLEEQTLKKKTYFYIISNINSLNSFRHRVIMSRNITWKQPSTNLIPARQLQVNKKRSIKTCRSECLVIKLVAVMKAVKQEARWTQRKILLQLNKKKIKVTW